MRSYKPDELFDDNGTVLAGDRRAGPGGQPADERQPARQRRSAAQAAAAARTSGSSCVDVSRAGRHRARADQGARPVPERRDARQHRQLPDRRPGRDRLQPARRRVRRHRQGLHGRDPAGGRASGAARPGRGDALRAHLPGLAGGVPADRPARVVLLLRGLHPPDRLDVQPARQVAQGDPRDRLAAAHLQPELPAHLACVAPGPQRLLPPGPGFHRPRGQQEGRRHPGVPAAGHQHAAVHRRALPGLGRTTSTSSSPASSRASTGWTPNRPGSTARAGSASGTGRPTTTATRTW